MVKAKLFEVQMQHGTLSTTMFSLEIYSLKKKEFFLDNTEIKTNGSNLFRSKTLISIK